MSNGTYRNIRKSKNGVFSLKVKPHINEDIEMLCKLKNIEKTAWCNAILEKAVKAEIENVRRLVNE